jgi:glycosidase
MPTSLFAPDSQTVFDHAKQTAGQAGGPFASPADWRDHWIYFLMLDRFNNPSAPPRHQPFDDPNFFDFQGGKFSGVRQQLPYLKHLGVGALWLSPVLKNLRFDGGSYHGYGIHDFLRAEPRFADDPAKADDELRALVDAAHELGIFVIFDIVLNHTGDVFAYGGAATTGFHPQPQPVQWRDKDGQARPEIPDVEHVPAAFRSTDAFVWPEELQRNQFFRRQGGSQEGGDDTVGDFASLKQMMTADPDLQEFLIRAYEYVIARHDVDGFRIDTLRYLKGDLPRLFGNSIREFALQICKKNFFTFGEVLDSQAEEDIARFIGRSTSDGSELVGVDAALDYPLFNTLKPTVKGFTAPTAVVDMYHRRKGIEQSVLSSHGDATRFFVTFLDNHDMKERIRFVQPEDEHRFDDQVTLGLACLYSLPGIPCLYYGTEQGLHGAGSDPAVREALWGGPGFSEQTSFYRNIRQIAEVRATRPALRYGRFYFRPVSGDRQTFGVSPFQGGALAFSRILNDEEVVVVANTNAARPQSLDVIIDVLLSKPGDTYRILYSNKPTPTAPSAVQERQAVTVHELDGSTGHGPLHVLGVTLQPLEVQILGR